MIHNPSPRELRPWARALSIFPSDIALALGPPVRRLARVIGPLGASSATPHGDPDGYGGLTRRGPYERLLATEWALAAEHPHEFTRRASMGEHAFLAQEFRTSSGVKRSFVLLDAGPSSLGAPRVVHLAVLIVLASRAESAGARFAWGLLQDPRRAQIAEVSAASVTRLLHGRSALEARAQDWDEWAEQLAEQHATDLWIVGPPRMRSFARAKTTTTRFAIVTDLLDPGPPHLKVEIDRSRSTSRPVELVLDVIAPEVCARLLRDPFHTPAPVEACRAPFDVDVNAGLFFSSCGRRIIMMLHDGRVAAFPIPGSPLQEPGRPAIFYERPGQRTVAAGWFRNGLTILSQAADGALVRRQTGRRGGLARRPLTYSGSANRFDGAPGSILPIFEESPRSHSPPLVAVDASGRAFRLRGEQRDSKTDEPPEMEALSSVTGAAQLGRRVVLGRHRHITGGLAEGAIEVLEPDEPKTIASVKGPSDMRVYFGFGGNMSVASFGGVAAIRNHPDRFRVFARDSNVDLVPPEGATVSGVIRVNKPRPDAALLILEDDFLTPSLVSIAGSTSLPRASHPITNLVASSNTALVAYATVMGEVVVYSLDREVVLLRVVPPGPNAKRESDLADEDEEP